MKINKRIRILEKLIYITIINVFFFSSIPSWAAEPKIDDQTLSPAIQIQINDIQAMFDVSDTQKTGLLVEPHMLIGVNLEFTIEKQREIKNILRKHCRSPQDALAVIMLSDIIRDAIAERGCFTTEEYRRGYNEIKNRYEFLEFYDLPESNNNDTQSLKGLKVLQTYGLITIQKLDSGIRKNVYKLSSGQESVQKALTSMLNDVKTVQKYDASVRLNSSDYLQFLVLMHIALNDRQIAVNQVNSTWFIEMHKDLKQICPQLARVNLLLEIEAINDLKERGVLRSVAGVDYVYNISQEWLEKNTILLNSVSQVLRFLAEIPKERGPAETVQKTDHINRMSTLIEQAI